MTAKRLGLACTLLALTGVAFADDYAQSWGPPVGTTAPAIAAEDQDGVTRNIDSLVGERGVLFVLSRSADW